MRTISDDTIQLLAKKTGIAPYFILEVDWTGGIFGRPSSTTTYSDKSIGDIPGSIISISNFDDVTNISQNSSINSVSVVLSDIDGNLKTIYDSSDIHLVRAKLFQGFTGSDLILLIEGLVSSNIVWDEGQRTFSFDIITKIADREVGFALEDAVVANLDLSLVGKPWPIVFGNVRFMTPLQLRPQPSGVMVSSLGLPDLGIPEQIWRLQQQLGDVNKQIQTLIIGDSGSDDISGDLMGQAADLIKGMTGHSSTLDAINSQLRDQAEKIAAAYKQIQDETKKINDQIKELNDTYTLQEKYFKKYIDIESIDFPEGKCTILIDDTVLSGNFTRTSHSRGRISLKLDYRWMGPTINDIKEMILKTIPSNGAAHQTDGFRFFNIGTTVTLISDYPITYIASAIPLNRLDIYAYRSYKGLKKLTKVPQTYYSVLGQGAIPNFAYKDSPLNTWFQPTAFVLNRPLNIVKLMTEINQIMKTGSQDLGPAPTLTDIQTVADQKARDNNPTSNQPIRIDINNIEEWDNELYLVANSSIGGSMITVMKWVINNFTDLLYDHDSFAAADAYVSKYRVGFLFEEKKNSIQFLQELALQARCALWLKEGVFFIRYLPAEPAAVDSITEDDIQERSIKLLTTSTEELKTKYTATYQLDYLPTTKQNKVIIKNNTDKYGLIEESFDYYAYNNHYCVKKSAVYWLLRHSNTWKRISFNTYIHKLNIESMDCVTLDIPSMGINCKAIIDSAVYDLDNYIISMTATLPILLGNKGKSPYTWPANLSINDISNFQSDFATGNPGREPDTTPIHLTMPVPEGIGSSNTYEERTTGGFNLANESVTNPYSSIIFPDSYPFDYFVDTEDGLIQSNYVVPTDFPGIDEQPKYDYKLKDIDIPPLPEDVGGAFPGKITSTGDDNLYGVTIYPDGIKHDGKEIAATQLQIDPDDSLDVGTWVLVIAVKPKNGGITYYIQSPVWE